LIIVESTDSGCDFFEIKDSPLVLDVPNKLVYSFHYYRNFWSKRLANADNDYDSWKDQFDRHVGFIATEGNPWTAPLWAGEFGEYDE